MNLPAKLCNCLSVPGRVKSLFSQCIVSELKERMVEVEKLRPSIEKRLDTIKAVPQAILKKGSGGEL
jgi:DNA-directed RNA polymerase specialized sigma54-like protein